MKHISIILTFLMTINTQVKAEDVKMQSLESILRTEKSIATVNVMLARCAALYMVTANWIEEQKDEGLKAKGKRFATEASQMVQLHVGFSSMLSGVQDEDELFSAITERIKIVSPEYVQLMLQSKMMSGSAFENKVVMSDFETCQNFIGISEEVMALELEKLEDVQQ